MSRNTDLHIKYDEYLTIFNNADILASSGDLEGLRVLNFNGEYCTKEGSILACINGHLHIVKYLESINRLCGKEWLIDYAAGYGVFHVLLYLETLGLECSSFGLYLACVTRSYFMISYLISKNISPDKETIDFVCENSPEDVIKILKTKKSTR